MFTVENSENCIKKAILEIFTNTWLLPAVLIYFEKKITYLAATGLSCGTHRVFSLYCGM